MTENEIVVSVCVITYGHEKYIREAIESILEQECEYDVEIIISNDSSPDLTDAIVQSIIKENSSNHKIRYFQHEKNLGMMQNFLFALEQCSGSYIALLEGDDYWTDQRKIQKQIDALESNPSVSMCFHRTDDLLQNGKVVVSPSTCHQEDVRFFTLEEIARGNFIHTPSAIFRKKFLPVPEKLTASPIGDYPLWLHLAACGSLLYLPECMAYYREGVGVWSGAKKTDRILQWCFTLFLCIDYFKDVSIQDSLRKQLQEAKVQLANASFEELARTKKDLSLNVPLKILVKSVLQGLLRKLK